MVSVQWVGGEGEWVGVRVQWVVRVRGVSVQWVGGECAMGG